MQECRGVLRTKDDRSPCCEEGLRWLGVGRQKGGDRVERPGWGVLVILIEMETSRGAWGAEVRWTGSWGYHLSSGRSPGEQVLT